MKVLFVTIAWPRSGERNLYTDLMDEFVDRGDQVHVVCTNNTSESCEADSINQKGIRIVRVSSGKILKANYFRKAVSLLMLKSQFKRTIRRRLKDEAYDLIIASTPPVTLSALYKYLKKRYNAPFYVLLKDIWPQGSVDLGEFRKYGIIWLYMRYHEVRTYKIADIIGTMSERNSEFLLANNSYLQESKVEVCPNSIIPHNWSESNMNTGVRAKLGIPEDVCIFLFSGNLGRGHGLGFLVNVIKELKDYPKAFFVLGGAGTRFRYLKEAVEADDLKNVHIYQWLPREEFEQVLSASDAGLVLLDNRYTIPQFPSRLLSYLDVGIPVLLAANNNTDMGEIILGASCGLSVSHGDVSSFVEAVKEIAENNDERIAMGKNARSLLEKEYSVATGYEIIMKHFLQ